MESCGIDEVGVTEFLTDGTGHTKFTRFMEGLDNCQKAVINNKNINPIKLYDYDNKVIFFDNGCGMKFIDDCLKNFKRDSENYESKSLSKCGIGLNALITGSIMGNNGYCFIITSYLNNNELEYECRFLKIIDNKLARETINISSDKFMNIIKNIFNGNTGTLIYINSNKNDENDYKKIIQNNLIEFKLINDKTIDFDTELYKKLSIILEGSKNEYLYNNKKIEKLQFIEQTDLNICSIQLYYNITQSGYIYLYCKDTNISYRGKKNPSDIDTIINNTISEEFIKENKLHYLGEYNVYIENGKITGHISNDFEYSIQYYIDGIRTIGFKKIGGKFLHKTNHNYLKCKLTIVDVDFIKKHLNGKKTDDEIFNMNMNEQMTRLHIMLSRIPAQEEILKMKGYTFDYHWESKEDPNTGKMQRTYGNRKVHWNLKDKPDNIPDKQPEPEPKPKPKPEPKKPEPKKPDKKPDEKPDKKPEPEPKNPEPREFTADQKRTIKMNQKSLCEICKIKMDDCHTLIEYDHIHEYSKGGKTNVENGRALCRNCHKGRGLPWANDKDKKIEHIEHLIKNHQNALELLKKS